MRCRAYIQPDLYLLPNIPHGAYSGELSHYIFSPEKMLGAYCQACFFGNKTEVWRGCGLPTVTEKGWARLECIFTFLRWSTFIFIV